MADQSTASGRGVGEEKKTPNLTVFLDFFVKSVAVILSYI